MTKDKNIKQHVMQLVMLCKQCTTEIPYRRGPGAQKKYCDVCKRARRAAQQKQRRKDPQLKQRESAYSIEYTKRLFEKNCLDCNMVIHVRRQTKYCPDCRKKRRRAQNITNNEKKRKAAREYMKAYRKTHAKEISIIQKRYRANNQETIKMSYAIHREQILAKASTLNQERRYAVLSMYSPNLECAYCGENWYPTLTIDHMNGDGHIQRKKLDNSNYLGILRDKPKDLQVLCFSCNRVKGTMTDAEFRAKYPERLELGKKKMESARE